MIIWEEDYEIKKETGFSFRIDCNMLMLKLLWKNCNFLMNSEMLKDLSGWGFGWFTLFAIECDASGVSAIA